MLKTSIQTSGLLTEKNFDEFDSNFEILEQAGFDVDMIGMKRIEAAASRWKKAYQTAGMAGLKDTRQTNSGRRLNRVLSTEEHTARLEAKIKLLEAENELLKKVYLMERGLLK